MLVNNPGQGYGAVLDFVEETGLLASYSGISFGG
jgi:hypothetical protein